MSKFLTPPVWYDKNGNLNEMLTGTGGDYSNVVIGVQSSIAGTGSVAIGGQSILGVNGATADNDNSIAIGCSSRALAIGGIAIGYKASTVSNDCIAIGNEAKAKAYLNIAIGGNAQALEEYGIAIGEEAQATKRDSIAIGSGAKTTTQDTIQLGDNTKPYGLTVGNGRMSLNIGSTAQGNWISATSNGISQGLYLVRYHGGSYMDLVYLMAPIEIMDISSGSTYTNDWYFPFYTSPYRLTINDSSHPIVCSCYYLKVDKTSSASNLKITPGYYKNDGDNLTPVFQNMADGSSVYLFKIL